MRPSFSNMAEAARFRPVELACRPNPDYAGRRRPANGVRARSRRTSRPMTDQAITRPRPATIIDVAREAGVAVGTVSRYINGLPIRGSNRERIAQVIEELGYRRNSAAASMKTNTT